MLRAALWIVLGGWVAASGGCVTAAKQAYYGVTGAKGEFYELQPVDSSQLAQFRSVRVEPFRNELGNCVPEAVVQTVDEGVTKVLGDERIFYPDGRQLVIGGRIIHYTGESGLIGAIGSVIGGDNVCVCRVRLTDGQSGAVIGEAACWGKVKSAIRRGAREYGEGVGKGIARWLEKRLPEAERDRRHSELDRG